MIDLTFFTMAGTLAVQVIAILEAMKNFIKVKLPAWVYTIVSAILSFALTMLTITSLSWVYIAERVQLAIFVFCLAELFYDSIWKLVKNRLERHNGENT